MEFFWPSVYSSQAQSPSSGHPQPQWAAWLGPWPPQLHTLLGTSGFGSERSGRWTAASPLEGALLAPKQSPRSKRKAAGCHRPRSLLAAGSLTCLAHFVCSSQFWFLHREGLCCFFHGQRCCRQEEIGAGGAAEVATIKPGREGAVVANWRGDKAEKKDQ